MKGQKGFSLLEIVIVAVIIGLLAAFAFPAYEGYVERGRLSEGRSMLMSAATSMERCYSQNSTYENCGAVTDGAESETGIYILDVEVEDNGHGFTLTAEREKNTGTNECGDLELDHAGRKDVTDGDRDDCW